MKRKTGPRTACGPFNGTRPKTLRDVVSSYIDEYRVHARQEMSFYAEQPSLSEAIRVAALSVRPDGKRHGHQRRIPARSLATARNRLQPKRVLACRSFDELHELVQIETADIHKIGALAVYDIAHRIGAFLGLQPTTVYLHCGTMAGARSLGFRGRQTLRVAELPPQFRRLTAAEIEDCLCIYKSEVAALRGVRSAATSGRNPLPRRSRHRQT